MITLDRLATLDVSAASGAVFLDGLVHVVADDGLSLHAYTLDGVRVRSVRLFDGSLPDDAKARKKAKPDLEALALLPDGSLLAIGSGSTDVRRRGALVHGGDVRTIDLAPLYEALGRHFDELNVEGLVVHGSALVLAQRGNGKRRENALVRLDLARAMGELVRGSLTPASIGGLEPIVLGAIDGVPLSFTDLASLDGQLVFSAAAEATDDPYLDAPCAGSALGAFAADGTIAWCETVTPTTKVEGVAPIAKGTVLLVSDADDPTVNAPLFRARLPLR